MLEQYIILQLFKTCMWRRFFENVVFHGKNIGGNYFQRKANEEKSITLFVLIIQITKQLDKFRKITSMEDDTNTFN